MTRTKIMFPSILTIFSFILGVIYGNPYCPPPCNVIACNNGVLSCPTPGLSAIPSVLPPRTDKVILINQDFSKATELTYANISNYGPPEFKVTKITIQYCQLIGIAPETFSHIHNLQILDLSYNRIKMIAPRTFEALNLNFLRLDGNRPLQFHCFSFQKSIIRHLSLKNCSITSLDFCVLKPLIGVLKKLSLSCNFLKTIDERFGLLFQRLDELRLAKNNFQCSGCQLKWLSRILQIRYNKFHHSNVTDASVEDIFPKCVSPEYLSHSFIHKLADSDFVCNSPAIKSIDVMLDKFEKLTLSCNSFSVNDKIVWIRNLDQKKTFKSHATIAIQGLESPQQYHCMVSNREGNVSTRLNINWQQALERAHKEIISSTTSNRSQFFDNNLYKPRFSLLELIAAVVVTFSIFLIIFIVIVRYSFTHRDSKFLQYPVIVECQNHLTRSSLKHNYDYRDSDAIRYDWFGNPSLGNSQTYDIPVARSPVFLDFKTHEQIERS